MTLFKSRSNNVRGKDETPFLLKRIAELTKGESLAASKVLYANTKKSTVHIDQFIFRYCAC